MVGVTTYFSATGEKHIQSRVKTKKCVPKSSTRSVHQPQLSLLPNINFLIIAFSGAERSQSNDQSTHVCQAAVYKLQLAH